ncbi:MAG: DUF1254 domain-containing protein [Candidatus Omnitrophota bacterium]
MKPSVDTRAAAVSKEEAGEIATEAYIYFYPLAIMDITRRQMTNSELDEKNNRAPMNTFCNIRTFPPADFRGVVRPNFDTLYSIAWLDITKEPMIVSLPDTKDRYYLLQMLDMWTDTFAAPGKRSTGTKAGHYAIVPPRWRGKLPNGVQRIDSPTPYVWVIGRTQTNGPKDYKAVHKVQDGFKITPLSRWGKKPKPAPVKIDPAVDMKTPPLRQTNSMPALAYFQYASEIMKVNPPHITDQAMLARMRRIGIEAGKSFHSGEANPGVRKALENAKTQGLKTMNAKSQTLARIVNGWQISTDTMGVYGNYYLKRAIIAMVGLGANPPEDAIYPMTEVDSEGKPLTGANDYVLHFDKKDLPPVNAFWSVTLYDNEGFQVANKIDRYTIGDRDKIKYNPDGSLDVFIQNAHPGKDKESNWLPAPEGPFNLTMRLYAPQASVLEGAWAPPAVKKVQK